MDSCNSASVQSSSGGSEELDSRTESISSFFNNNPSSHAPLGSKQPPLMQQQQSTLFDTTSNYMVHPLSRSLQLANNPNPLLNLDMLWSRNLRSEPNCNGPGSFMASSSSLSPTQQLLAQSRVTFSSMQQGPENGTTNTDQPNSNNMVRNSKKRPRASRRAPTTVLTTDPTNFRAMVQEFTGIPAPPFTSSPFKRTKLDLFGTPSSNHHYLLKPFAQKLHTISSMLDATASTPSTYSSSTSTSINYHQLPGLLKQPQNPFNMQPNPILNYVSLLQTPSNDQSSLRMGVFEDFGSSQGHGNTNTNNLSGLQNMASSSEATGSTQEHDQNILKSINDSYNINSNTQRVTNEDDRGTENVASRNEGMVETWICSSD